jgi:hypothetical protein
VLGAVPATVPAKRLSLDLGVAADDLGETGPVGEPGLIHPADPGRKWRMMHQHQSRPILCAREDAMEPLQPLRAESPAALARHQSIERDDAQWVILDRVIEEPLPGQVPVPDERLPHRFACIVVARNRKYRHAERRQESAQMGIFLRRTAFHEITGEDYRIG